LIVTLVNSYLLFKGN